MHDNNVVLSARPKVYCHSKEAYNKTIFLKITKRLSRGPREIERLLVVRFEPAPQIPRRALINIPVSCNHTVGILAGGQ